MSRGNLRSEFPGCIRIGRKNSRTEGQLGIRASAAGLRLTWPTLAVLQTAQQMAEQRAEQGARQKAEQAARQKVEQAARQKAEQKVPLHQQSICSD